MWFRGTLDKGSFDEKIHKSLGITEYKLHNKFLVALFNRSHALAGNLNSQIQILLILLIDLFSYYLQDVKMLLI